jgi:hypothetical protein
MNECVIFCIRRLVAGEYLLAFPTRLMGELEVEVWWEKHTLSRDIAI